MSRLRRARQSAKAASGSVIGADDGARPAVVGLDRLGYLS